jgi:membrane protein required for colicin V production
MNWLDWTMIALVAFAAIKGFSRGLIVELASLVAFVAAVWAGIHLSERVAEATGIGTENAALAFLVTFILVILGVHLLARGLTTLVDIAQLSLPNKVGGILFGGLRSLFMISVALNLMVGYSDATLPPAKARDGATLYAPVRAFAPLLVPALEETKWVKRAVEGVKHGIDEAIAD